MKKIKSHIVIVLFTLMILFSTITYMYWDNISWTSNTNNDVTINDE